MLKKLKISLILFSMPLFLMGSGFEGKIKVVKKTYYDTSHYYYYVKDNKVRIDEYNQHDRLINSLIIDLSEERVFALNQDKKIYKELQPSHHNDGDSDDKYVIKKTNNTKRINGYLCYQWRVRNREKNSEIAYWVTKDGFQFFESMMKIVNNIGNCSDFFLHIPEKTGFLPILTVERNLVRYEKLRLVVTNIEHRNIQRDIFTIPSNYKKFHN